MVYLATCGCGLKLHITENDDEVLKYWDDVQKLVRHFRENPECVFEEVFEK